MIRVRTARMVREDGNLSDAEIAELAGHGLVLR
jgi:hypothetical protein